jgi:hypothetical protein
MDKVREAMAPFELNAVLREVYRRVELGEQIDMNQVRPRTARQNPSQYEVEVEGMHLAKPESLKANNPYREHQSSQVSWEDLTE